MGLLSGHLGASGFTGGAMAALGGVAGAGEGMQENAEAQRKIDMETAQFNKAMQLEKLRQDYENNRQSNEISARHSDVDTEVTGRMASTKLEVGSRENVAGAEIDAANKRNANTNQTKKDIQDSRTQNAKDASKQNTWTLKTVTQQPQIDPVSHALVPGKQDLVLFHPSYGAFVQNGDRMFPYSADGKVTQPMPETDPKTGKPTGKTTYQPVDPQSVRRAAPEEVQKLMANPEQAPNFINTYHYLPTQFNQVIRAQNGGASSGLLSQAQATAANPQPGDDADEDAVGAGAAGGGLNAAGQSNHSTPTADDLAPAE